MAGRHERIRKPEPRSENSNVVSPLIASQIREQQGNGATLDQDLREHMEAGLEHSFADIRVHSDAAADELNRDLEAQAFTFGRDVFWSQRAPRPHTADGQRLLAHELTHVVQQRSIGAHTEIDAGSLHTQ